MKSFKNIFILLLCIVAAFSSLYTVHLSKLLEISSDKLIKSADKQAKIAYATGLRTGAQMIASRITSESFIKDAGKTAIKIGELSLKDIKCDIPFRFKDGVAACVESPKIDGDKNERQSEEDPGGETK